MIILPTWYFDVTLITTSLLPVIDNTYNGISNIGCQGCCLLHKEVCDSVSCDIISDADEIPIFNKDISYLEIIAL